MNQEDIRKHAHEFAKGTGCTRGTIGYRARYAHFMHAFDIAFRLGVTEGDRNMEKVRERLYEREGEVRELRRELNAARRDVRTLTARLGKLKVKK